MNSDVIRAVITVAPAVLGYYFYFWRKEKKSGENRRRREKEERMVRSLKYFDPWDVATPPLDDIKNEFNYFDPWESPKKVIERRSSALRGLAEERKNLKEISSKEDFSRSFTDLSIAPLSFCFLQKSSAVALIYSASPTSSR